MQENNNNIIPAIPAICYSGFREGQSPATRTYPTEAQVTEDLLILAKEWRYLRLYDCDPHARMVLEVIRKLGLDFKVMLGAYIEAEMNNFGCPWGGTYSEQQLEQNTRSNERKIQTLIDWANEFPDIVHSLSAGNEATVDWTDHYVPVRHVIKYVKHIKRHASQPVTFCENYVPWLNKLAPLADEVDFISIHTYPVWEYKHIHEALEYTQANYQLIADRYPDKQVVITEAGWTTNTNGRGIDAEHTCENQQQIYYQDLMQWTREEGILTFVFEAFDEPWKGSDEPMEPEKHWGLFTVDRKPKQVMKPLFPELSYEPL